MTSSQPWWRTDTYDNEDPVPESLEVFAGPRGIALVRAWPSGITDPGWGLRGANGADGFMPRYQRSEFDATRIERGFVMDKWNFAFIMRSLSLVCIDIDGKNNGYNGVKNLGKLPKTLAETSKSGDGYHLFFEVDEQWNTLSGFNSLADRIGIEEGVDIRATGCVYHHKQQRWNDRPVAPLPKHLHELLMQRSQKVAATTARITSVLANDDPMEVLMMQDEILTDLAKPIPEGKRNNTLFAIGSQMLTASIPDWEDKIDERAQDLGLEDEEITKLIANIKRYGDQP